MKNALNFIPCLSITYIGDNFTHPIGSPSILSKYRIVDMYTSCTQEEVKDNIINSFCLSTGHFRIVIITIAFSMGLDIPDILIVFSTFEYLLRVLQQDLRKTLSFLGESSLVPFQVSHSHLQLWSIDKNIHRSYFL